MTSEELEYYLTQPDEESREYLQIKKNRPSKAIIHAFYHLEQEDQDKVMKIPCEFRTHAIQNDIQSYFNYMHF